MCQSAPGVEAEPGDRRRGREVDAVADDHGAVGRHARDPVRRRAARPRRATRTARGGRDRRWSRRRRAAAGARQLPSDSSASATSRSPPPGPGVAAQLGDVAADEPGRLEADPLGGVGDHGRGRRLAVGPADADRAPLRDQLGQELAAAASPAGRARGQRRARRARRARPTTRPPPSRARGGCGRGPRARRCRTGAGGASTPSRPGRSPTPRRPTRRRRSQAPTFRRRRSRSGAACGRRASSRERQELGCDPLARVGARQPPGGLAHPLPAGPGRRRARRPRPRAAPRSARSRRSRWPRRRRRCARRCATGGRP